MSDRTTKRPGNALLLQGLQMSGAKAIELIRTLILARLLLPDDFGLMAIAATVLGFLFILTDLGMVPALVQGQDLDEDNYHAAWTVGVCRSLILGAAMVVAAPLIAATFSEPRAAPIIQVLALRPFIASLASIRAASMKRTVVSRPLAVLYIADAIFNTALSIWLARTWGVWALVAGMLAGSMGLVITSYILAPYRPRLVLKWETIKSLIHFSRWVFATNLIALGSGYLLRVLITRQFGSAGLGIYMLASQLAYLPGDLAGEVEGSVAVPLFARLCNQVPQATRVFRGLFRGLAAVLFPICALFMLFAPSLARYILGPNWAGTGELIRIFAATVMIGFFGDLAASLFKGFGQPHRITLVELVQSSFTLALAWILTRSFGLAGAALAWLPTISFSQFLNAIFLQKILDQPFRGLLKPLIATILATGLSVGTAMLIMDLIPGFIGFVVAAVGGLLIAAIALWTADRLYRLDIARSLVSVFPPIAVFAGIPAIEKE